MRVKCLAQEHNAVPWPGLKPGLFDTESSVLTIRPPRLHKDKMLNPIKKWKKSVTTMQTYLYLGLVIFKAIPVILFIMTHIFQNNQ